MPKGGLSSSSSFGAGMQQEAGEAIATHDPHAQTPQNPIAQSQVVQPQNLKSTALTTTATPTIAEMIASGISQSEAVARAQQAEVARQAALVKEIKAQQIAAAEAAAKGVPASQFRPDFSLSNPYAGAPQAYLDSIKGTQAYQDALKNGWITLQGGSIGAISQSQIIKPEVKPFKPDFTKASPYEGITPEYIKQIIDSYLPTKEHPLPPLPQEHIPLNYTLTHPVGWKPDQSAIVSPPKSGLPEGAYYKPEGVTVTKSQMDFIKQNHPEVAKAIETQGLAQAFMKYGDVIVQSQQDYQREYVTSMLNPMQKLIYDNAGGGQDGINAVVRSINNANAVLQPYINKTNGKIDIIKAVGDGVPLATINLAVELKADDYQNLRGIKNSTPQLYEILAEKGYGEYKKAFDSQYTKVGKPSDNQYVANVELDKITNPMLRQILITDGIDSYQQAITTAQSKIDKYGGFVPTVMPDSPRKPSEIKSFDAASLHPSQDITTLAKFQRENPNDKTSISILYGDGVSQKVSQFNDLISVAKSEIQDKVINGKSESSYATALTRAIENTGYYKPYLVTQLPTTVVEAGVPTLTGQQIAQKQWDNLTDSQKDDVIIKYMSDPGRGSPIAQQYQQFADISSKLDSTNVAGALGKFIYGIPITIEQPYAKIGMGQKPTAMDWIWSTATIGSLAVAPFAEGIAATRLGVATVPGRVAVAVESPFGRTLLANVPVGSVIAPAGRMSVAAIPVGAGVVIGGTLGMTALGAKALADNYTKMTPAERSVAIALLSAPYVSMGKSLLTYAVRKPLDFATNTYNAESLRLQKGMPSVEVKPNIPESLGIDTVKTGQRALQNSVTDILVADPNGNYVYRLSPLQRASNVLKTDNNYEFTSHGSPAIFNKAMAQVEIPRVIKGLDDVGGLIKSGDLPKAQTQLEKILPSINNSELKLSVQSAIDALKLGDANIAQTQLDNAVSIASTTPSYVVNVPRTGEYRKQVSTVEFASQNAWIERGSQTTGGIVLEGHVEPQEYDPYPKQVQDLIDKGNDKGAQELLMSMNEQGLLAGKRFPAFRMLPGGIPFVEPESIYGTGTRQYLVGKSYARSPIDVYTRLKVKPELEELKPSNWGAMSKADRLTWYQTNDPVMSPMLGASVYLNEDTWYQHHNALSPKQATLLKEIEPENWDELEPSAQDRWLYDNGGAVKSLSKGDRIPIYWASRNPNAKPPDFITRFTTEFGTEPYTRLKRALQLFNPNKLRVTTEEGEVSRLPSLEIIGMKSKNAGQSHVSPYEDDYANVKILGGVPDGSGVVVIGDLHGMDNYGETIKAMVNGALGRDVITGDEGSLKLNVKKGDKFQIAQLGDISDRGKNAIKILDDFLSLQKQARQANAKLGTDVKVNLAIGNHDLAHITKQPIAGINYEDIAYENRISKLYSDNIINGNIVASIPIGVNDLGVHAGLSLDQFPEYKGRSRDFIVNDLNRRLKEAIAGKKYGDQMFNKGRLDGGNGVGGIFWYRPNESPASSTVLPFKQFAGHTPTITRGGKSWSVTDRDGITYVDTALWWDNPNRDLSTNFYADTPTLKSLHTGEILAKSQPLTSIAVPLSEDMKPFISDLGRRIKSEMGDNVELRDVDKVGLTVQVPNGISPEKLAQFKEKLNEVLSKSKESINYGMVGGYPNMYKPAYVYLGLKDDYSLAVLVDLQKQVNNIGASLGYSGGSFKIQAGMTLGKLVSDDPQAPNKLIEVMKNQSKSIIETSLSSYKIYRPSMPVMITKKMEAKLKTLGYSDVDIAKMNPQEAWGKIGEPESAEVEQMSGDDARRLSESMKTQDEVVEAEKSDDYPPSTPTDYRDFLEQTRPMEKKEIGELSKEGIVKEPIVEGVPRKELQTVWKSPRGDVDVEIEDYLGRDKSGVRLFSVREMMTKVLRKEKIPETQLVNIPDKTNVNLYAEGKQLLVNDLAKQYNLPSKKVVSFDEEGARLAKFDGIYDAKTDTLKLQSVDNARTIIHELVRPEIYKLLEQHPEIIRGIEKIADIPENSVQFKSGEIIADKSLSAEQFKRLGRITNQLNESAIVEYVKRISGYDDLAYKVSIADRMQSAGIGDKLVDVTQLANKVVDYANPQYVKSFNEANVGIRYLMPEYKVGLGSKLLDLSQAIEKNDAPAMARASKELEGLLDEKIARETALAEKVQEVSEKGGQALVDAVAERYGLESKPLRKYNLWDRFIKERDSEGFYDYDTGKISLKNVRDKETIIHELAHPKTGKVSDEIVTKIKDLTKLSGDDIENTPSGMAITEGNKNAFDVVSGFGELTNVEYLRRITGDVELESGYKQYNLDLLDRAGQRMGIENLGGKMDEIAKSHIDSLNPKLVGAIDELGAVKAGDVMRQIRDKTVYLQAKAKEYIENEALREKALDDSRRAWAQLMDKTRSLNKEDMGVPKTEKPDDYSPTDILDEMFGKDDGQIVLNSKWSPLSSLKPTERNAINEAASQYQSSYITQDYPVAYNENYSQMAEAYKKEVEDYKLSQEVIEGERLSVEKPSIEKPPIETVLPEKLPLETIQPERPAIETPSIEKPTTETPIIEKPSIETPIIEKPIIERPPIEKPPVYSPPPIETPPPKPPVEPPILTQLPEDWAKKGVPPGTLEWRQGKAWVVLPPPYRDENKFYLGKPLPGTTKFAVGKGSAAKTLQVLGGAPERDVDLDMGWARVKITTKGGLKVEFGGGEEAINKRWEEERQFAEEYERELAQNPPLRQARQEYYDEVARLREMRDQIDSELSNLEEGQVEPNVDRVGRFRKELWSWGFIKGVNKSLEHTTDPDPNLSKDKTVLNKRLLSQYSLPNVKVYLVDPTYVCKHYDIEFVGGSHSNVDPYVPKGEVWLSDNLSPIEQKYYLLHEMYEYNLMAHGMDYHPAHERANVVERKARSGDFKLVDAMLKQMFDGLRKEMVRGKDPAHNQTNGEQKIVWAESWKDLPDVKGKGESSEAYHDPNTDTIYLVKGKAKDYTLEHEKFHSVMKHEDYPEDPAIYARHELEADKYAYGKLGEPKSNIKHIRSIAVEMTERYKLSPQESMEILKDEFSKVDPPETWQKDFGKLEQEVTKLFGGSDKHNETYNKWVEEKEAMPDYERQAYENLPSESIRGRVPRAIPPRGLQKTLLPQYSNRGVKVYTVNGDFIRDVYADQSIGDRQGIDFMGGGHGGVYWKLIPRGEIWVEENLKPLDRKAFILHEIEERERMLNDGLEYSEAHNDYANPLEAEYRQNYDAIDEAIQEALTRSDKPISRRKVEPEPVDETDEDMVVVPSYTRRKRGTANLPRQPEINTRRTYLGYEILPSQIGGSL